MNCCRKNGKWIANLVLLAFVAAALGLLVLNILSPGYPTIRCKGNVTHDPDISHKYNPDTISTSTLLTIGLIVPLVEILIAELAISREPQNVYEYPPMGSPSWKRALLTGFRWYRDYFFGVGFMLLLNDIAKTTFGAPRPHWVDSCRPKFREEDCYLGWVSNYKCTNTEFSHWKLADSRKSFPSGHSALSFYAAVFMILYQTNRLRARRWGPVVILFLHVIWGGGAIYCALSRITDHRHHPRDVIAGGILGALSAVFSAMVLCGNFSNSFLNLESYQNKVVSGLNGNATILDGFSTSPTGDPKEVRFGGGTTANGNGPPRLNGDMKRPSLRRLLSTQSNMTTMSEIAEDRELDNL